MSFDNINSSQEGRKANTALLIMFTVLSYGILFLGLVIPFAALVGIAAIAIPSTLLLLRERKKDAVICAVAGSLFLFFIDYLWAGLAITYILAVSFIYFKLKDEKGAPSKIIIYSSLVMMALLLIYFLAASVIGQTNLFREFLTYYRQNMDVLTQQSRQFGQLPGISEAQIEAMVSQSSQVLFYLPYIMPSLVAAMLFFTSMLNYYFSSFFLRKYNVFLKKMEKFQDWDLPWHFCIGIIVGLLLILIPGYDAASSMVLDVIGYNFLAAFILLYTVLGFSVLIAVFKKYKLNVLFRLIIFFLLFFMGLIVLMPVVGLADIWINFRKIKRKT
jgi:hypothetical protein